MFTSSQNSPTALQILAALYAKSVKSPMEAGGVMPPALQATQQGQPSGQGLIPAMMAIPPAPNQMPWQQPYAGAPAAPQLPWQQSQPQQSALGKLGSMFTSLFSG